jgi:hypothetical protein
VTQRHIVAGIAFTTAQPLPELSTDGFCDHECTVEFISDEALAPLVDEGVTPVGGPGHLVGAVRRETAECWVVGGDTDPVRRAWHLKQLAPIFSAAFGRVVLHAAAVGIGDNVFGFIGESGAGKSTLAATLTNLGHHAVSDDLLPVRFEAAPLAPIGTELHPIGALCFLERGDHPDVRITRLDKFTALDLQIANGFGEHHDPASWSVQFDGYHRLVESVPHFEVSIPDDIEALPKVAEALLTLVADLRAPARDAGAH